MNQRARARTAADAGWTFLTNHAHVLLCIAALPEARLRDLAQRVGITERAVQRIVAELEAGGYLRKVRDGRRNRYVVKGQMQLRHPVEQPCTIASLIEVTAAVGKVRPARQVPKGRKPGAGVPERVSSSNST